MISDSEYVSPDGSLRFLVRSKDGDITLGFDGVPSHSHGDVLASERGLNSNEAVESFVTKLLASELIIAVAKVGGEIRDIWVTENPAEELRYSSSDETIDFRLWNGTRIAP